MANRKSRSSSSTTGSSFAALVDINLKHLSKRTPERKTAVLAGPYLMGMCDEEQSSSACNDVFVDSDTMVNQNAALSSHTGSECDEADEASDDDDGRHFQDTQE